MFYTQLNSVMMMLLCFVNASWSYDGFKCWLKSNCSPKFLPSQLWVNLAVIMCLPLCVCLSVCLHTRGSSQTTTPGVVSHSAAYSKGCGQSHVTPKIHLADICTFCFFLFYIIFSFYCILYFITFLMMTMTMMLLMRVMTYHRLSARNG